MRAAGFLLRASTVATLVLAGSMPAHASLIGDTVGTRYVGDGDTGVQLRVVVDPGEEGNFFGNQFYDYGPFSFQIRSTSSFCGILTCTPVPVQLQLSSLHPGSPITGVLFSTNLAGVSMGFTADSVTFSWTEQPITPTTYLRATFETAQVPEPAALTLMLAGLAALRTRVRRRG